VDRLAFEAKPAGLDDGIGLGPRGVACAGPPGPDPPRSTN